MVKKLKTPVAPDSSLHDTFFGVAESYCKGTVTIDEAVSQIEQAVRNYLAERQ